jgi:hypothetical protein
MNINILTSVIIVTVTVIFLLLALIILYITVIPKMFKEMRLFPKDPTTVILFYAKIIISFLILFLLLLGIPYLMKPIQIKITGFLFAYALCGIISLINSILWFFLYNVESKKPLNSFKAIDDLTNKKKKHTI